MLQRTDHPNGVVTFQSPLLRAAGVTHAFSTRIGGLSPKPFDSLNLGNPTGCEQQDPEPNVIENYSLLQRAIGADHMLRAWVRQVHGRSVELIEREPENEYAETLDAEIRDRFSGQTPADALVTTAPDILLTVRIADCVPILIASDDGLIVSAVHAGWRGVVGNIIEKTLRTMHEAGAKPDKLVAAIGPAISLENFEVGEEVAAAFMADNLEHCVRQSPGQRPHVDLQSAVRSQLKSAGVHRIDSDNLCTYRDANFFFSHRRDNGITGRMAALIAITAQQHLRQR